MKVFYLNIENFLKTHDKEFLLPYADREFKNEKHFYEHAIGRYLVKSKAKEVFNINDTEIILNNNGKPVFKNADLFFSISHSNNMVAVCFDDKNPCGIDIEYIKPRNLENLSKHYNKKFKSLDDFYKFWTIKEASFKAGYTVQEPDVYKLKNYYAAIVYKTTGNK